MEARSYNPRYARTRYRNYIINVYDWVIFFFISFILGLMIFFIVKGVMFGPLATLDAILIHGA
jgi:energy-coupling factor transport system permease protein